MKHIEKTTKKVYQAPKVVFETIVPARLFCASISIGDQEEVGEAESKGAGIFIFDTEE